MSHTITKSAPSPFTPIVHVSFDGAIDKPIMRGAVPDYKATAQHLAGWIASLRESLKRESGELSALKRDHAMVSGHYQDLAKRHDVHVRAITSLRNQWYAFLIPRSILFPQAEAWDD